MPKPTVQPETYGERVAYITYMLLDCGLKASAEEVAKLLGIHYNNALGMLKAISRVVPIYDDAAGVWQRV